MGTILDTIADHAKLRVAQAKEKISLKEMTELAIAKEKGDFPFERALKKTGISFICEVKKASPSKGIIAEDFPYLDIACEYEKAGADAVSVLTEPKWFLGSNDYLKEIAQKTGIPVLRKDFTVDEYMIYEAKVLGASAVLLIVSILSDEELCRYQKICRNLGLSALVETHDEEEIKRALDSGAVIIGVNNRNLKDFSVDTGLGERLRDLIPKDVIFVSESGVKDAEDIEKMRSFGADAVLVGETMMRAPDKTEMLKRLKGEA
ncbi:MAG: indole-3-glycerol phosphate synthase TrpC [Lachnospiraceae bacterium]|nr:indole-3-glycerol phosphate synthase TrpC [Lachnospiraceae bacterium]